MAFFILCDSEGAITQYGQLDDESFDLLETAPGITKIRLEKPPRDVLTFLRLYRLHEGAIMARRPMECSANTTVIKADGKDLLSITGLPKPCTVTISGMLQAGPFPLQDGELHLTADVPGILRVQVEAGIEWIPWEAVFRAT